MGIPEDADIARIYDGRAEHINTAGADAQLYLPEGPINAQELNQPEHDSSSRNEQLLRQLPCCHSGQASADQQSRPLSAVLAPSSEQHLLAQMTHLAHALHAEQQARAEADSQAQQLTAQLQMMSQHTKQLTDRSGQLAQESELLIAADAELTLECQQLSADNAELAQQVQTLLAGKAHMSQQAETMVQLASRQNLNVKALRDENAAMAQQLEGLTAAKAESSEQSRALAGSYDELSQQVEQLKAEQAENFDKEYSELSQCAEELKSSNADFRQQVVSLHADKLEITHELQRQYTVIQNASCIEAGMHELKKEQAALIHQVAWLENPHSSTTNDQVPAVTSCTYMQCLLFTLHVVARINDADTQCIAPEVFWRHLMQSA